MEAKKILKTKNWHKANRAMRIELSLAGLDEEEARHELYAAWVGKHSASEMTTQELRAIAEGLKSLRSSESEISRARKRVIAAVREFLEKNDSKYALMSEQERIERVKAVACRASKTEDFNRISMTKLRAVYNTFLQLNKVMNQSAKVLREIMQ